MNALILAFALAPLAAQSAEDAFDWQQHNQRRHDLATQGDVQGALRECDAILRRSVMDGYILSVLSGWEKAPQRAAAELQRHETGELPFAAAAINIRIGELLTEAGDTAQAAARFHRVQALAAADPALEAYAALARARLGAPPREGASPAPRLGHPLLDLIHERGLLTSPDVRANRRGLRKALTGLSLEEAKRFMDAVRAAGLVRPLVEALTLAERAQRRDALVDRWVEVFSEPRADFLIEALTYVEYASSDAGTVYFPGSRTVDIYDYAKAKDAIVHESCHGFMHEHRLDFAGVGLNEGLCIALPKHIDTGYGDIAEAVFGTVLYYRDVGISGYPRAVAIGDANTLDAKGQSVVELLMEQDPSPIDWFNPRQLQCLYDRVWSRQNRNVAWDAWLAAVKRAKLLGRRVRC
ncbi:MAG: hypothetical protein HY554_10710 [Elusimicrobia bacterium]|nr:hypothetical protein [Elusimicrobiota bacterium]